MSRALARAAPSSSMVVVPSVTRLVLPPRSYCTTHRVAPPSRRRKPKPPRSLSQNVLSFTPAGSVSVLMVVVVSFKRTPPMCLSWAGPGQVRSAFSCLLLPQSHWRRMSETRDLQGLCVFVHSLAVSFTLCSMLEVVAHIDTPSGASR